MAGFMEGWFGRRPPEEEAKKPEGKTGLLKRKPTRFELMLAASAALTGATIGAEGGPPTSREVHQPSAPVEFRSQEARDAIAAEANEGDPVAQSYAFEGAEWPLFNPSAGTTGWERIARLAEPGFLTVSKESSQPESVSFVVPYEYARFFDTGDPMNPADYAKMQSFMEEQIRSQLGARAIGLNWDVNEYTAQNGAGMGGLQVEKITLVGTASPEAGMESGGPETIVPGHVEQENMDLGQLRATDAAVRLNEVLDGMGIETKNVSPDIMGDELQFRPEEFRELESLARAQGYKGPAEQAIYQLITAYNRDQVSDPTVQSQLDQIVAGKRTVEVDIQLKNGKKDVVLIPLPLLGLLALPALVLPSRRKRKPGEPEESDGKSAEPVGGKTDQEPVERPTPELTSRILERWTESDNETRARAGLPAEASHETRPRQVLYAQLHARALQEVAKWAITYKHPADASAWAKLEVRQLAGGAMRDELASQPVPITNSAEQDRYIADVELDLSKNFDYYTGFVNSSER